jgi:NAD(P)-dependent dehydrogenase (short-subunit alcohol dehydrogenase family)
VGRLDDKVAIITGSTRGLGEAMARRFALEGASVLVTGRTEHDGEKVASEIRDGGGKAAYTYLDQGDEDSVRLAMDKAVEIFGKLNVLVNNAAPTDLLTGAGTELKNKIDNTVTEMSTEDWHKITRPSIDGLFWCLKYGIPKLQAAGKGSIINISSTASIMGTGALDGYTASKGALNALTRSTAVNYAPHIRSNCLIAGPFATDGLKPVLSIPRFAKVINAAVLTETVGDPDDMAQAAVFMASDESRFITGQLLSVDGGYSVIMPMPKVEDDGTGNG